MASLTRKCVTVVILLLVYCALASAYIPFRHEDCSTNENAAIRVITASVSPYPIQIPGDAGITPYIVANVTRPLRSPITLHVRVSTTMANFWFDIPCVSRVGSCTYDLCALTERSFSNGCPRQLAASSFPCTCPVQPGTYTLYPRRFVIGRVSSLWRWMLSGDYILEVKLTDSSTGENLGCSRLHLSIEKPCTSWFQCLIGK